MTCINSQGGPRRRRKGGRVLKEACIYCEQGLPRTLDPLFGTYNHTVLGEVHSNEPVPCTKQESKSAETMLARVISVSGGKDSTALYLWAREQWSDFRAVFADTGHEHPVTVNYVKNLHEMAKGPKVEIVKADFGDRLRAKDRPVSGIPMQDLVVWKGRAPSARAQFCTEFLKLRPIRDWLDSWRSDKTVEMYVGIRAAESARRAKMPEHEMSDFYDCDLYRPLLKWSEEDVWAMLKKHDVPPNPLYAAGSNRVGCYPCIHARKRELAAMPDWAWDRLQAIETAVGQSWFSAGDVPGVHIPTIADARRWSKTKRGGREEDPNAPDIADVPSCMGTWGTCE